MEPLRRALAFVSDTIVLTFDGVTIFVGACGALAIVGAHPDRWPAAVLIAAIAALIVWQGRGLLQVFGAGARGPNLWTSLFVLLPLILIFLASPNPDLGDDDAVREAYGFLAAVRGAQDAWLAKHGRYAGSMDELYRSGSPPLRYFSVKELRAPQGAPRWTIVLHRDPYMVPRVVMRHYGLYELGYDSAGARVFCSDDSSAHYSRRKDECETELLHRLPPPPPVPG